ILICSNHFRRITLSKHRNLREIITVSNGTISSVQFRWQRWGTVNCRSINLRRIDRIDHAHRGD
ncbi:unnamed protein product, partial [Tilletia laevis]